MFLAYNGCEKGQILMLRTRLNIIQVSFCLYIDLEYIPCGKVVKLIKTEEKKKIYEGGGPKMAEE